MSRILLVWAVLSVCIVSGIHAAEPEMLEARVSLILTDKSPATWDGDMVTGGSVALDYDYRSLLVQLKADTLVTRIVLKADPATNRGLANNRNMKANRLDVYSSNDGITFTKVRSNYAAPDALTVVLDHMTMDGLTPVRARYWKVHYNSPDRECRFINDLAKMALVYGETPSAAAAAAVAPCVPPWRIPDPLFEPLLSDQPGQGYNLYWQNVIDYYRIPDLGGFNKYRPWYRAFAKKHAYRYVYDEILAESAKLKLYPFLEELPDQWAGKKYGICYWPQVATWNNMALPVLNGMPGVIGETSNQCWMMDPRWSELYLSNAVRLAKGGSWGIFAGDELWSICAIKVVPKERQAVISQPRHWAKAVPPIK